MRWRLAGDTRVGWDGPQVEAGVGDVLAVLQAGDAMIPLFDVDGQRVQGQGVHCLVDDAGCRTLVDGDLVPRAPFRLADLPHF
ncbi:MAG: hypothetical protein HY749_01620 [Gammaproteobacteria bacterium]|nr:hypothetical protein [Gammaproteobacteria bacterium]MBI5615546.1 hypothetical protein [Gammaproteobacteria bacterium]